MINVDIKTHKIKDHIFTASPSKRCCVLETFLINNIGFKPNDINNWINSLAESERNNKVICLDGVVLEDFKAEYIKSYKIVGVDHLYMLTSEGVRSLFMFYEKSNKQNLAKIDKIKLEELAQKFISIFADIRSNRINRLVFWEEEVKDVINIPDMPSGININNSPGVIVNTGNQNHASSRDNRNEKGSDKLKENKPIWFKVICWIFFFISIVLLVVLFYFKYQETGNIMDTFKSISWKGIILSVCALLSLIGSLYK